MEDGSVSTLKKQRIKMRGSQEKGKTVCEVWLLCT